MKVSKSFVEKGDRSLLNEEEEQQYAEVFNLIEKFNIDVGLDKMIAEVEKTPEAKDRPRMNVKISVPKIGLQLKPLVYKSLLRTPEFFSYSKDSAMELMEDERMKLMQGNSKLGVLYVREKKLRDVVWTKYLCILKGKYLYFFKNSNDPRPSFTYFIRDAEVNNRDNLEKPCAFSVKDFFNSKFKLFRLKTDTILDTWLVTTRITELNGLQF